MNTTAIITVTADPFASFTNLSGVIDYVKLGSAVKAKIRDFRAVGRGDLELELVEGIVIDDEFVQDVNNFLLQDLPDAMVGKIAAEATGENILALGYTNHKIRHGMQKEFFPHKIYTVGLYETAKHFGDDAVIKNGGLREGFANRPHRNRHGRFVRRTSGVMAFHRAACEKLCMELFAL